MKILLKKIISSNIVLYYLWFVLIRKRKGLKIDFFQKDTDIYVDGYARSGNTFIIHLIKRILSDLNVIHHLHTVAPIKIAFLKNIPVFILIRDPMNSISSKYLKHFAMRDMDVDLDIEAKLLDQFIEEYLHYYSYVLKNQKKISIIRFDELINSPQSILKMIDKRLQINKDFSDSDISKTAQSYKGATDTMGSSRPNPEKEKYKTVIKKHISDSDKYQDLLELYESIITNE